MIRAFDNSRAPSIVIWVLISGAAGFAAGFFGPMALDPDANQGPLVGILMTGPGGLLLGLILSLACRLLRVPLAGQWRTLWISCSTMVLATLYFLLPPPQLRGYVVDAEIQGCKAPSETVEEAIQYWEKRVAEVTWAPPRAGWQNDVRTRSREDDGVVLDMAVLRRNEIYEGRKPWNLGAITSKGWQNVQERKSYYAQYAGGTCADYPVGTRSVHFTDYDLSVLKQEHVDWPPIKLPDFLDLQELTSVPERYQSVLGN